MGTETSSGERAGARSAEARKPTPGVFVAWAGLKTAIQVVVSLLSISFIVQSCFFVPGMYDATVWSKRSVQLIYIVQALFEAGDLATELWMLRHDKSKQHLPWDSIMHHSVSGGYALYIYLCAEELDHGFLGLSVAALSCQVIGPLYTMHRFRVQFRYLALLTLIVQALYRCPLAFVSLIRAFQFRHEAPWIHFLICAVLAHLDIRWTRWAYRKHSQTEARHREAARNKAE